MPPRPQPAEWAIPKLLQDAAFSFVGTIERLGAATMADVPVDGRTAIALVEQVLHAPDAFSTLAGSRVTLQLGSAGPVPGPGTRAAFFANAFAFGESVALTEVGRLDPAVVEPHAAAAMAAGGGTPLASFERDLELDRVREHAAGADAVVVGRVEALVKAPLERLPSEHDPEWWIATLDVDTVAKGSAKKGKLDVLYANSLDVRWRRAPKPKAGQSGLWLLHAVTDAAERKLARFALLHPEDLQGVQTLDAIRETDD